MSQIDITRNSLLSEVETKEVFVFGVGAIGSHLVLELIKLGVSNIFICDPEGMVKEHNLSNQAYDIRHVGKRKVQALQEIAEERYNFTLHEFNTLPRLDNNSTVFNCVDVPEGRSSIREQFRSETTKSGVTKYIETAFDVLNYDIFLVNNTSYVANINDHINQQADYVGEVTSACGARLSVSATVQLCVSNAVWIYIKANNNEIMDKYWNKRMIFDIEGNQPLILQLGE